MSSSGRPSTDRLLTLHTTQPVRWFRWVSAGLRDRDRPLETPDTLVSDPNSIVAWVRNHPDGGELGRPDPGRSGRGDRGSSAAAQINELVGESRVWLCHAGNR